MTIDGVRRWMDANKLKFNYSKIEFMVIVSLSSRKPVLYF